MVFEIEIANICRGEDDLMKHQWRGVWIALWMVSLLAMFVLGGVGCDGGDDRERHQNRADAAGDAGEADTSADVEGDITAGDVGGGGDATSDTEDGGNAPSPWTAAAGYAISGTDLDRSVIELARTDGGFGDKPGGGPPRVWDFGTEVYVDGQPVNFNAELGDGETVAGSPLYDRVPRRQTPIFETSGANLRFEAARGHYFAPGGSPDGEKAGAYFLGVEATGGKTSSPEPFRDGRYYYSFRHVYPEGTDDNSLKTMRGSQRDSQQDGWYGSAAGNIDKNGWSFKGSDGTLVWPPPRDNGHNVPVWSNPPGGDVSQWHLQEMLIDPTGDTKSGKIFNTWYLWFADTGRNEWQPAMQVDPDGNEVGRWAPNEHWDDTRGFYHQVGPEPAGYKQPDYYFGEVYVDDSWKRLYLGNAPTWSETSQVELQRPIIWEDDRIEFALNVGALHSQAELYLYWVDNANQATFAGTLALENTGD
jgi:hypothetical protein